MRKKYYSIGIVIVLVALFCCVLTGCNKTTTPVSANSVNKFYSEWMKYLSDDVKLNNVVIPGSHDAGTSGMANYAETQSHQMDSQMKYGIRYFDIRVSKKGENLYFFHNFDNKNYQFKDFCLQSIAFLEENPSEFLILDFQHFKNDSMADVEKEIEQYLKPNEYAVKQGENITDLTMGKIRTNGYRYIIFWADDYSKPTKNYQFSRNTYLNSPYDSKINNQNSEQFVKDYLKYYEKASEKAFFVLQAQHTCNYAKLQFNIKKREMVLRPIANRFFIDLYNNADLLEKTNIIMRDFVTEDIETIDIILNLNTAKNNFENLPNIS